MPGAANMALQSGAGMIAQGQQAQNITINNITNIGTQVNQDPNREKTGTKNMTGDSGGNSR
jgi:hypothetical protein